MSSHPIGSGSPSPEWNPSPDVYHHAQRTAALRAAAIALVLLVILAIIVFF
jgi:hypothetical protein